MSLEEKINAYKLVNKKIDELETQKKALVAEILNLMPREVKTLRIAEYCVKRMSRLSIRISLENAKLLSATKMEEVVDKEKIKQLFKLGQPIPDVSEVQFIQVSLTNHKS